MSSSVRWVACTAAVRGPSAPASASSWVGVRPGGGQRIRVLRGLLGQVNVQTRPAAAAGHHRQITTGTARTEWIADAHPQLGGQAGRPAPPRPAPCRRRIVAAHRRSGRPKPPAR